jgi:ElaB/YqjD/DUF883 family membrane-anchored ribosome-binding protein
VGHRPRSSAQAADSPHEEISAALDAARATLRAADLLARRTLETARATDVATRVEIAERPYVALGIVAGMGFVAAGGLTSPAVWRLARFGARLAVGAAARRVGEAILSEVMSPTK